MKLLAMNLIALAFLTSGAAAQGSPADSAFATSPPDTLPQTLAVIPTPAAPAPSKIFYGGSVMLSFGESTHIGIFPHIGYKISPKLSVGGKVGYEYVSYDDIDQSSHNYGGGVFGRYRFIPALYAQAEFQVISYDLVTFSGDSEREAVPFLLLGGGYIQPLSPRTSLFAEVLVDVLQDDNSPYDDWEPRVSLGIGVGF